jgi:cell division protein FtsQ
MTDQHKPAPQDLPPPDTVLVELLAAFSNQHGEKIDFDDPAIDRMLGLADDTGTGVDIDDDALIDDDDGDAVIDDDDDDDVAVIDDDDLAESDVDVVAEPLEPPTADVVAHVSPESEVEADITPPLPPLAPVAPAEPSVLNPDRKLIVIGGDDEDQPDAVYLDEEAGLRLREVHTVVEDESGGRSTIIIKDLDEDGAIEALPARSSGSMDPRVRARRIAVRRAKGRKRLIWVAIGAAIVLVLVGAVAVLASSLFDVRQVSVQGAVYTDPQRLSAIVDGVRGDAILLVDTRQIERQLEGIAWVESARVSTDFPHGVLIDIRERKPVGTFRGSDGGYRVIDRDGRVLDVLQNGVPIDYMLITGANPDVEPGQFAGRPFASAAQLTIALPDEIRALTESMAIDVATETITLQLRDGIEVQLGTPTDLSNKLAQLLSQVRDGLPKGKPVDLSTG